MIDTDEIKRRIAVAEYAAVHFENGGSSAAWYKYYNDNADTNAFIQDFRAMLKEIELLRATIFDLENKCEAAGIKVGE